uniref:Zinc finger protein 584 n=1 Tax=Callithrix jacchus TaxID=9483 RepID=A0A8I4A0G2_CALJA
MLENFALLSSLGLAPSRSPVFTQLVDDEQSCVTSWVDVTLVSRTEASRGPVSGLVCHLYCDFQDLRVPASLACVSSLPFSVFMQSCLLLSTQCMT